MAKGSALWVRFSMDDFLAMATEGELLILLSLPLGSAILLVIVVIIFRRQPQKPALGQPPKRSSTINKPRKQIAASDDDDEWLAEEDDDLDDDEADELDISVLSSLGQQNSRQGAAAAVEAEILPPLALEPAPAPIPQPAQVELLRLLRDAESGELVVQIGGQSYHKLTDIASKAVGEYLLEMVAHLLAFTNGMYATTAGVKSTRVPTVGDVPVSPPSAEQSTKPTPQPPPPRPEPIPQPPPRPEPTPQPPPPPAQPIPIPPAPRRARRKKSTAADEVPLPDTRRVGLFGQPLLDDNTLAGFSLASQINDIVQKHLERSPLAATIDIEISDGPGGGIQIDINGQMYEGVGEIPPGEVKQLIEGAIKEWERS